LRFENEKLNGGQQKYDTNGKCMVVFIDKAIGLRQKELFS